MGLAIPNNLIAATSSTDNHTIRFLEVSFSQECWRKNNWWEKSARVQAQEVVQFLPAQMLRQDTWSGSSTSEALINGYCDLKHARVVFKLACEVNWVIRWTVPVSVPARKFG